MNRMKSLVVPLMIFCGAFFANNFVYAQTWTPSNSNTNQNWKYKDWGCVASSADGVKLVATADNDGIYTSTNSGLTWTQTTAPGSEVNWSSIASSADGCKLAAVTTGPNGGYIYTSTNSGATWTFFDNFIGSTPPNQNWSAIVCSADGNKLLASVANGGLYSSTNAGNTWETNGLSSHDYWGTLASSADGTRLAAGAGGDSVNIYTSTNAGATWTKSQWPEQGSCVFIGSADGTKLSVIGSTRYFSTNWGATWNTNITTPMFHPPVAGSADATKVICSSVFNVVYSSMDSGISFITNDLPVVDWSDFATSADGNKWVAVADIGGIWLSQKPPSPQLQLSVNGTNLLCSWLVPSTHFILEQSYDLTNWTPLTNSPALNFSNLQNQISLPISGSGSFSRLVSQ